MVETLDEILPELTDKIKIRLSVPYSSFVEINRTGELDMGMFGEPYCHGHKSTCIIKEGKGLFGRAFGKKILQIDNETLFRAPPEGEPQRFREALFTAYDSCLKNLLDSYAEVPGLRISYRF